MRKSLVFATLAGLVLASCSNEEFVGGPANSLQTDEIGFSTGVPNMTRATVGGADAAKKLNNRFVVYGWKTLGSSPVDVFNNYVVTWNGNSGNSLSNTAGWEYVGNTTSPTDGSQGVNQFIKYWDYSATSYDFIAWSVTGTAYLESINKSYSETGYKTTALTFQCKDATAVSNVYFSNQKTVEKTNYKTKVDLTFRNLAAKVRLGIYETVPGYSVKDVKFYTDATSATPCDNATLFVTPNHTPKPYQLPTSGSILVKYSDGTSGTAGDAVSVTTPAQTATYMQFGVFSADKGPEYKEQDRDFIGRTSSDATLSKGSTDGWTYVMPNDTCELNLKVDYTLVPNDGSAATITVKGAAAVIPASYGEWKSNCAYTYIFKISDNTNGTTGSSTTDPAGLYPLTFDACVEDAESSTQETISSVADPSITTYQNGSKVTEKDEYEEGEIYYMSMKNAAKQEISGSKVYEVIYSGTTPLTENFVANYMKNDVSLALMATTGVSSIPNTNISLSDTKHIMKFSAKAGKTYAINIGDGWKLVKVSGTPVATTYKITCTAGQTIGKYGITAEFKLTTSTGQVVLGAKDKLTVCKATEDYTQYFTVVEVGNGMYTAQLNEKGLQTGVNGTYLVKFNGTTQADNQFEVDINYVLRNAGDDNQLTGSKVTVVCGNFNTFRVSQHKDGESYQALSGAVIDNPYEDDDLLIEETSIPGTYKVSAANNTSPGTWDVTIAGLTLTIEVNMFSFNNIDKFVLNFKGECSNGTLFLKKNGESLTYVVPVLELTGIDPTIATITENGNGQYKVKPLKYGSYTVKYENAEMEIVVEQYTLTKSLDTSIKKTTGTATLTLKKNGVKVSADKDKLSVQDGYTNPGTFTLTQEGQNIIFSNASAAGTYKFQYKVGFKDVAHVEIEVTD